MAKLDKAAFPGNASANPQTYPQIKFNKNTCILKVEELDAKGNVVPNTASTFEVGASSITNICGGVTTQAAYAAANPGSPNRYVGFTAGTYKVTITAEVVVTASATTGSTTRNAVVSGNLTIYAPPP
jgi:hypothetical protein